MAEKWTDDKMPSGRAIPKIPQKETGPHGNREPSSSEAPAKEEGKERGKKNDRNKTEAFDDDRFQATDN